jgi:anti-sigma B factor antagonist
MRAKGMTGYQINRQQVASAVQVIAVGGELDMRAAPELKGAIALALDEDASRVVVDLSDATFIDSTGMGTLVAALKRLRKRGGSLELVCTEPNLLRVFELTGLDRLLPIRSSRSEALGAPTVTGAGA